MAYLGDPATVTALVPPSGSAQAAMCARFYPMARNALLEMHTWSFATKRVSLPLLSESNQPNQWSYTYQCPPDALNLLAILDPNATDDYAGALVLYGSYPSRYSGEVGIPNTVPFSNEIDANGNQIILTNMQYAELRYTAEVTDTTTFSPLFIEALTWLLASKMAGPLIKGSEGRNATQSCLQQFQRAFGAAIESDSNQRNIKPPITTGWIVNR
nr:hypothetical protein [Aquitalea palustris]